MGKVAKTIGRPLERLAGTVGKALGIKDSGFPRVDFNEQTSALQEDATDDAKRRLRLLKTGGGYVGQQTTTLGNTQRNILGN